MCGIAGLYNLDGKKISPEILHSMDLSLSHRGPDGHGEYLENSLGLANRRLAIIDTDKRGNQPLSIADGKYVITFNGEIFNYRILKQELKDLGYKFKTETDTEVVLVSYLEFGKNCVTKFLGQFAFAIWDKKNKRLFLARDHLGINPLYYSLCGKTFLFASEVKALLASKLVKKDLDPEALSHFLSVFSVPAPLTIIKGIKSILPGTTLVVTANGIKEEYYWRLPESHISKIKTYGDAKEELEILLSQSVKSSLVADVPVGAFLSGGVDSASVVALMSRFSERKVKTFSLYAKDYGESFDERKYAGLVAEKYHCDHTEYSLSDAEILSGFPGFITYLDQPNGESLETYFLSKVIGREVKVALSGLGGDELFAGYHSLIYNTKLFSGIYQNMPASVKLFFQKLIPYLPLSASLKNKAVFAHEFFNIKNPVSKRFLFYFVFKENEKRRLLSGNFKTKIKNIDTESFYADIIKSTSQFADTVDKLAYLDLQSYTRDNLLTNTNMASMASSLEVRVPFLDRRLVEYSFQVPSVFKLNRKGSKQIFRDIASAWLPPEIISHKKAGFGLPRIKYMQGVLKPLITEALSPASINKRGLFNAAVVSEIKDKFYSSKHTDMLWTEHLRVWILFIFEHWARTYLD